MAEIHLQRKRPGIWPAIVAAFALIVGVWALAMLRNGHRMDEGAPATPRATGTSGVAEALPAEVAALVTFGHAAAPAAGPAHEYTAAGLRRLSAALDALIEQKNVRGANVRERLDVYRGAANLIQKDTVALTHANRVREAFTSAASLLSAMHQERWSDDNDLRSDVEELRAAASAIDPHRPLLEQTSAVREFFGRAADAILRMAERP